MDALSIPDLIGYAAAVLVILTFLMKTMVPLRWLAIASNIVFIFYGWQIGATPVWILHSALLPLNCFRLFEIQNISRRIRKTRHYGYDIENILPLMDQQSLQAGQTIFRKGDKADALYVLSAGKIEIQEQHAFILPGMMFGEIGLFTNSGIRTGTAVCLEDCQLHSLSEEQVAKLYFQNPEFGYALMRIAASRMASNIEQLEARLQVQDSSDSPDGISGKA